jgi:predicted DNA-binding protein YlxM (UPF0122 family)
METIQLEQGRRINEEQKNWVRLLEHLERKIDDPIKEVNELLTSYNNLMHGFSKKGIAEIMIESLKTHTKDRIIKLQKEFDEL